MSTDHARHAAVPPSRRQPKRARLGTVCTSACAIACALVGAASPAAAQVKLRTALQLKHAEAERVSKEPFGHIPKGPLQIIISIDQQTLHLYSNGIEIADALVATGVPAHPTPLGIFSIIQKNRFHRSNIYSAAPMPYMERITWSGVALHEGGNLGHRASHGCIRMSQDFAMRLWALTRLGARVIIAHPELRPAEIADPHLFVRQATPAASDPTASAPAAAKPLKTAQTSDAGKTADVVHEPAKNAADPAPNNTGGDPPAGALAQELRPSDPGTSDAARPGSIAAVDPSPATPPKPIAIAHASKSPIAIFVSRKTKTIYVRQDFSPLFNAPVTIEHPDEPLGSHVFTAMEYLDDHAAFRWNVVSLPGEPTKAARHPEDDRKFSKYAKARRRDDNAAEARFDPPPQTPQQALARIDIPQDVIDQISQLIVPGSSLVISDQGLGDETGEGTDFIVATRDSDRTETNAGRSAARPYRPADAAFPLRRARALRWEEPYPPAD